MGWVALAATSGRSEGLRLGSWIMGHIASTTTSRFTQEAIADLPVTSRNAVRTAVVHSRALLFEKVPTTRGRAVL